MDLLSRRQPRCRRGFRRGRVHGDRAGARALLEPMAQHLADYGVGSIAEVFDAETPFAPGGCIAQAWSVAETLRAWCRLDPKT